MVDLIRNILSQEAFISSYIVKTFLEVTLQSADLLQGITPPCKARISLTEFRNKLQAFYYFQHVDSVLGLPSDPTFTLSQTIEKTYTLGPVLSVWATEGLGHYYTRLQLQGSRFPRNILSDNDAKDLPRPSLIPLHAGMGLALAESLLGRELDPGNLANQFLQLCRTNARPGHAGAAIEALGLVARTLHPELIPLLDREFAKRDEDLLAYFWHGVGRGTYFTAIDFLPSQGYKMCAQESPHALARSNAVAGYVWALVLVNIRQPEVLAAFLRQADLSASDAIFNGIFSALVIWLESAPQDTSVKTFYDYDSGCLDSALPQLWSRYVQQATKNAVQFHRQPACDIGALFRYQPFATLVH